jgi:hypothetical protein
MTKTAASRRRTFVQNKTDNLWSETSLSWSRRRPRTSAATNDKGALSSNAWVEYDVKPLLSGDGTYSFILATSSTQGLFFRSRESSDTAQRPELVVTASR